MATYPRRKFLAHAAAVAPAALLPRSVFALQANVASADPWARADAIVKRIVAPKFAARDFDVTKFGAVGDGRANCTAAIAKAIAACRAAGGGRVVIPDGRFLTGADQARVRREPPPGAEGDTRFQQRLARVSQRSTRAGKAPS